MAREISNRKSLSNVFILFFFLPFLLTHASSTPFAAPESTTFFAKKLPTFPNPTIPTLLEHRPFLLVGSIV